MSGRNRWVGISWPSRAAGAAVRIAGDARTCAPCPRAKSRAALILALARAKSWMRDLRARKYADTKEIARRFKFSDAPVRRILRIGYLAPDIIEAIVEGRQPRAMTVKRLPPRHSL